jgi:transposase-like protein
MNVIGNGADQEVGRWLNNRAENSHQPFRRREGAMSKRQRRKDLAKVRLNTRFDKQSFQSRPPSQQSFRLQEEPLGSAGRVASTGGMNPSFPETLEIGSL